MISLKEIDLDARIERSAYRSRLPELQLRLRELVLRLYQEQGSMVLAFEGWDAAGKGGSIRRLVSRLDPRGYRVLPIAAPDGDEASNHYLWRFWRRLEPPRDRQLLIFDRSWYGRVLVERVEGFASDAEWRRAYDEINGFEAQLVAQGIAVAKLWFHISEDEQLRRFERRHRTPHKRWKLTDEDWRNRERWPDYAEAVEEMLESTDQPSAPWHVIAGNDKLFARIRCLEVVIERLERYFSIEVPANPPPPTKPREKREHER